jgi:hypothetical protein
MKLDLRELAERAVTKASDRISELRSRKKLK